MCEWDVREMEDAHEKAFCDLDLVNFVCTRRKNTANVATVLFLDTLKN
jgi:hypothetical protein